MAGKSKASAETAEEAKQVAATEMNQKTAARETPGNEKKEATRYMYIGPTVPGIGIQNRVYTDIPQEVVAIMKDGHPVIGDLFIRIRDYPTANRMIREQRGYLYNAYLEAEKIRMENAKKAENTFTGGEDTEERG